jgi:histidinol-phosphate aminotransferase
MLVSPDYLRLNQRPDPREVPSLDGWIDLASNELPVDPPLSVAAAAQSAAADLRRYPEIGAAGLRGRLARHLLVDRDRVVIGAGASALLRDLLLAVCDPHDPRGNEIVYAVPAFDGYLDFIEDARATPVPVPLRYGRQDLAGLAAAIDRDRCRAVLVPNPHNPTGALISGAELEDFLDRVPAHVLVVLDEAYREYALPPATETWDVPDGLHLDEGHPDREGNRRNVVVVRTWSKAGGLGAVRVGYLAADPVIAAMVAKRGVKYGVNRVAAAAAAATLAPAAREAYQEIWSAVARTRDRMTNELRGLGADVPGSHANFLWLPLRMRSERFVRHCEAHRIRVRAFGRQGVRVAVGLPEDNARFMAAATTFFSPGDRDAHTGHGTHVGTRS